MKTTPFEGFFAKDLRDINYAVFGMPNKKVGTYTWSVPVWNYFYNMFVENEPPDDSPLANDWSRIGFEIQQAGYVFEIDGRCYLVSQIIAYLDKCGIAWRKVKTR